jgi:DNA repair protein RecN (Recombination protein N)
MSKECENVKIIINDLALSIQQYATNITFDAGRLEEIRRRMVSINSLKKKYGGTIDAIRLHKEKLEEELGLIENYDEQIDELKSELEQCRKKLLNISLDLSDSRKKSAQKLCEQVTERLKKLGMPKAKFDVSFRYNETSKEPMVPVQGRTVAVNADGIDQIEFLVTTNVGESPKPLVKVASGGEISRIMLALKSLLAESDRVPVLIFDEIDMGISGRIAQSVGTNLRELANSHQTICITHLPQIASLAQHHYLVEKISDEKETHIQIRKLNTDERVEQIARLFGGEIVTETHLQSAKELINAGENN